MGKPCSDHEGEKFFEKCGLTMDDGEQEHECALPADHSDCEYDGYHECACGQVF